MRTLMLIASIVMMGAGTFCIANSSAAFTSLAFVIGLAFCIVGLLEIIVSNKANINGTLSNKDLLVGGILIAIIGAAILSGTISDNNTVTILFAFMLTREGIIDFVSTERNFRENDKAENFQLVISIFASILGLYMFFNSALLNIGTMKLVGAAIIIMGLRRFKLTFDIMYIEQSYYTGAEERLDDANADYKVAVQRAKAAIKESKEAQARIDKIKEEMANERGITNRTK